jgi:FtsH-binding integral membrane protein
MAKDGIRVEHPNRRKASSQVTRSAVILLLLASAGLVTIVTLGGWGVLQGAKTVQVGYIVLYVVMAFYVARWNRGVLPVAAALGIVLLIFAAVSGPAWFARDKTGFASPALPADVLGLVTFLLIPLQVLLIAFAMRGFAQQWNVEVERDPDGTTRPAPAAG